MPRDGRLFSGATLFWMSRKESVSQTSAGSKVTSSTGFFNFIAVYILGYPGYIRRSKKANGLITVNTDRYSRMTRVVFSTRTTTQHIALIFIARSVILNGMPLKCLTKKWTAPCKKALSMHICTFAVRTVEDDSISCAEHLTNQTVEPNYICTNTSIRKATPNRPERLRSALNVRKNLSSTMDDGH